jgi:CRP-like cAMP-binding protein
MLRSVPLLSECTKQELRTIASLGVRINVPDGKVLTTQGQPGSEFFMVVDGKARCEIDGKTVAHFGPGDFLGEMALLEHGPRHATVVAEGPMDLLVLDGREFSTMLDASPTITRKLLNTLAKRERANSTMNS